MIASGETLTWWLMLCAATMLNVAAWGVAAWRLEARRASWPVTIHASRRHLLWLSAAYVLGCGFRSVLPMVEVPALCLHDVWISRVAITRSVATVAEICFVLQWALLLREAGAAAASRPALWLADLLLPVVVLAEVSCWTAVLTTSYLPHAIENSLWTLAAGLAVAACLVLWRRVGPAEQRFLAAAIVSGLGYIAFMVMVDVPMYIARWQAQLAVGHDLLPLRAGLERTLQRCVVEHDWAAWRDDAVWLSLYFTAAVWISIALVNVPPLRSVAGAKRVTGEPTA
jgi:hypothetical protein